MEMNWVEIVVSILSGLAVCIPLVIKLVDSVQNTVKEKNWSKLMNVAIDLMSEAEKMFSEGAAKKAWVMAGIDVAAKNIDYPYDDAARQKISDMIDAICDASKVLNAKTEKNA